MVIPLAFLNISVTVLLRNHSLLGALQLRTNNYKFASSFKQLLTILKALDKTWVKGA